jgi:hypothetical protein
MAEEIYSQIFTLTELISAPLIATVQGDFYAAERFVTYLRKYGFEPPPAGKPWDFGKLRMVVFQYNTPQGWMTMQIPLISLIPLPLLSVSDADFKYTLKILGMISPSPPTRDPQALLTAPLGVPVEPNRIRGSFAALRPQNAEIPDTTPTLVANMDIRIQMRQSDLPAGIAAMLNVVQSAVEGSTRDRITLAPAVSALTEDNPSADLAVTIYDNNGDPAPNYTFGITATPREATAHLAPPDVVKGTLLSQTGEFSLSVMTDSKGEAAIRWTRGKAPDVQVNVTVTASASVAFPGGQFGPVSAAALLQILPSNAGPGGRR